MGGSKLFCPIVWFSKRKVGAFGLHDGDWLGKIVNKHRMPPCTHDHSQFSARKKVINLYHG